MAATDSGSTSTPAPAGTNSGGPPTRVATTERSEAIASSRTWPNGSTTLGRQSTSLAAIQSLTPPGEVHSGAPGQRAALGAVADEGEGAGAERSEGVGQAPHVLALVQGADEEKARAVCTGPPDALPRGDRVPTAEALEVDPRVDDHRATLDLRRPGEELPSEEARVRDHGPSATQGEAGGRAHGWARQVAHVAAVGHGHERRAGREGGERPGRAGGKQEVGKDDVGPEGPRAPHGLDREPGVLGAGATPNVDHRPLERVPLAVELPLDLRHEGAEIGVSRTGVHLGDEEDPHGAWRAGGRRSRSDPAN